MTTVPGSKYVFPPVGLLFEATPAELEQLSLNEIWVGDQVVAWLSSVFLFDALAGGFVMKYLIFVKLDARETPRGALFKVMESGLLSNLHKSDFLHTTWKSFGTGISIRSSEVLNLLTELRVDTQMSMPWQKRLGWMTQR